MEERREERDESGSHASNKLGTNAYTVVGLNSKYCEKEYERKTFLQTNRRQLLYNLTYSEALEPIIDLALMPQCCRNQRLM